MSITRRALIAGSAGLVAVDAAGAQPGDDEIAVTAEGPAPCQDIPKGVLRIDYVGSEGVRDWALLWPPASDVSAWVVNLHGHGSNGDQIFIRPDLRDAWLPLFRRSGAGLLAPNLRGNAWMSPPAASDLHGLLDYMRNRHGATRFAFASGSMGGTGTLIYAVLHPDDVAGAVALCPATDIASYYEWCRRPNEGVLREIAAAILQAYGGEPGRNRATYAKHSALRSARRLTMPLYVAHGTADDVIPVSQTRRFAGALADEGNFVYTEVADGGHDSPLPLMPGAFHWMMRRIG